MTLKPCGRSWQAEAAVDRRLSEQDIASFERHAQGCSRCARVASELAQLQALAERLPVLKSDGLQHRRARNELLRKANERLLTPQSSRARLHWAAALVLLATALAASALLFIGSHSNGQPTFELRADAGGTWRVAKPGPQLRLALERGRFNLSVDKLEAGQGFVLELPDGELEVRGTRFVVELDSAFGPAQVRTAQVSVEEGCVALRVKGQAELVLNAGQSWFRGAERTDQPSEQASEDTPPAGSAQEGASAHPAGLQVQPEAGGGVSSGAQAQPKAPVEFQRRAAARPARNDFAVAMEAFSRGDFATAEKLFQTFEKLHPASTQVEDALFLRSVARLRRGDKVASQALAREYLHRYPNGFRSVEARQLVE